ncbi:hypothetical protein TYRP_018457 [Tyrophagus putrescentiae]|nr:hypothetical protein TYRP_018457 [Tyrophagus putrescentiae]
MNGNSVSPTTLLKREVHHPLQPLPSSSPPNSSCTPTSVSPETITAPNNSMHQLGQQLLCNMNSLLTISNSNGTAANNNNSNGDSTTSGPPVFTTKEQLAEQYQLAKLRLNQDLLGASAFYSAAAFPAYAFAASPYAEAIGGGKMGGNHHHHFLGPNGYHHHRFRYGAHPSLPHHHHHHHQEDPKPQHSYIGLIAMAILSMPEQKMVLSDIYQHILDHYPYFRNRGPGWRNSIRHNLSLNDCFIKSGRSANGKGHYWAIHPANLEDFRKGDFRRRKAQRKVRKHMGLSVPDDDEDDDDDGGSPGTSPVPGVVGGILSAEKAAMAAAAAAAAAANLLSSSSNSSPNPFVQAAIAGNPMFQLNSAAANPVNQCAFSAQAFNFFNSLRFAAATAAQLPPPTSGAGSFQAAAAQLSFPPPPPPPPQQPSNAFNETLYRQLINLNIKQDLQSAVNRVTAVAAARNSNKGCSEFSIESLLSSQQQQNSMPEQQQQQQQQVHPGLYNGIHHHPLYHHPTHHHHFQLLHQRTASTEDSDVDSETEGASFLSCKGGGGGGGGKGGNDSELSIEEEITSSSSSAASSLLLKCEHGIKQQQQHLQPVNLKIN